MREKNTVTKEYIKDCRIFADAFNQLLYKGEKVIQPERLHPLDTTELALPQGTDGAVKSVERLRDSLKFLSAMEDNSAVYVILGVENQSEVHYAMPVRDMLYDALQYAAQVNEIAKQHRVERKAVKKPNAGEFLSGFYKEDRLVPVITLAMHFGAEKWDGPRTLHEMLTVEDPELLAFVSDYKVNLLSPADMTDEELDRFGTSLREVMLFIKYSKDKEKLNEMLKQDEGFKSLDRQAATVISTVTGTRIRIEDEEEQVDMCEAIQGMLEDATAAGVQRGRQEGRKMGRQEGRKLGHREGAMESKREMAGKLLARSFSYGEVMELTGLTEEEVQKVATENQLK